jgi:hypothetical protein
MVAPFRSDGKPRPIAAAPGAADPGTADPGTADPVRRNRRHGLRAVGRDTGPRLPTLLLAIGADRVRDLLYRPGA